MKEYINSIFYNLTTRKICDSCGKVNPKTMVLKSGYSRYTQCCAYSDTNSAGKTWTKKLRFPIKICWLGFWY